MTKVLYITVSPKKEEISISKKLGSYLLEQYKTKFPDHMVETLDLYTSDIPEMSPRYLYDEVYLKKPSEHPELSEEEIKIIERIDELSNQFLDADVYMIVTPMWSLSFPARLKRYIDAIALGGRVLGFKSKGSSPEALLSDKPRTMIYLETSGGDFPFYIENFMHQGSKYCKHLFEGLGISKFEHIYVEGVVQYRDEQDKFLKKANKDIKQLIEQI